MFRTYEELTLTETRTQYDIGICIKGEPPLEVSRLLRFVIIDTLDNYVYTQDYRKHQVPRQFVFLAQNSVHAQALGGWHQVRVIEEMFTYHNETSRYPTLPPQSVSSEAKPLTVFSAHRCKPKDGSCPTPCVNLDDIEGVSYDCLLDKSDDGKEVFTFFTSRLAGKTVPPMNSTESMFHSQSWLRGFFWNELFRTFDVLIVYAKKEGLKYAYNSLHRMTNALRSGVPTMIERVGIQKVVVNASYPCAFRNPRELRERVSRLRWDLRLRWRCHEAGLDIAWKIAHPRVIWGKYEALFRSFLDGELPPNPMYENSTK